MTEMTFSKLHELADSKWLKEQNCPQAKEIAAALHEAAVQINDYREALIRGIVVNRALQSNLSIGQRILAWIKGVALGPV